MCTSTTGFSPISNAFVYSFGRFGVVEQINKMPVAPQFLVSYRSSSVLIKSLRRIGSLTVLAMECNNSIDPPKCLFSVTTDSPKIPSFSKWQATSMGLCSLNKSPCLGDIGLKSIMTFDKSKAMRHFPQFI